MWINYIAYTLISTINVYCLSSFTTVTSSKTDNAVFIYPGQVYFFSLFDLAKINNNKIYLYIFLRQKVNVI